MHRDGEAAVTIMKGYLVHGSLTRVAPLGCFTRSDTSIPISHSPMPLSPHAAAPDFAIRSTPDTARDPDSSIARDPRAGCHAGTPPRGDPIAAATATSTMRSANTGPDRTPTCCIVSDGGGNVRNRAQQ